MSFPMAVAATLGVPGISSLAFLDRLRRRRPAPGVVHATFETEPTAPSGLLEPHDAVDIRHCPRHGMRAHRITPTSATCWTCDPNGVAR